MRTRHGRLVWLLGGDAVAVLIVTMIGFLDHYGAILDWRWLTTFLPVLAAWLAIAPWLGVYRSDLACRPREIWRPALAALLAAPLAATLRGLWLNSAIPPIFVVVLGLTNALGLSVWRLVYALITNRLAHRAGQLYG